MPNLLVNSPSGEQKIFPISETGSYFDPSLVEWDERTDGQLPEGTELGKMQRVGDELVKLDDFLPAHAAAINKSLVPVFVTKRQARLALLDAGLLPTINEFVTTQSDEVQIYWNDSAEIYRLHPLVLSIATVLNLNESQIDDLFIAASQK